MRLDIEAAKMLGADGVVVGALTKDARIDVEQVHALVAAAGGLPVTFHRAFDLARDQEQALETLIQLHVARVLTSGGAATALEGVSTIAALARRAANQIEVMAGGSVREENVQEIVHRAGVRAVHVRGTRLVRSKMLNGRDISFRKPLPADQHAWEETDERRIREFVRLANE